MHDQHRILEHADATSDAAAARCRAALQCLAEAEAYARDVRCDVWEFAVDWDELRSAGAAPRDLRWLLKKGYIAQARHTNVVAHGRADESISLVFGQQDRFIATDAGLALLAGHEGLLLDFAVPANRESPACNSEPSRPHWDAQRRALCVGTDLVKRFRQPSPVQELILAAFEEEGWPQRIADPLPGRVEQDPKRRLHDAIRSLNQNQVAPLIRFGGDGTGEGVLWELTAPATEAVETRPRLRIAA